MLWLILRPDLVIKMDNDSQHIDNEINKNNLFRVEKPDYTKAKDEVWNEVFNKLEDREEDKVVHSSKVRLRLFYGIAATLLILLGTTLMMRFYSESLYCQDGDQITHILPDGSQVVLKPNTTLTYYPFWWSFSRRMILSGEAYFEVVEGNEFMVSSPLGSTKVLGTSFTINSRNYQYIVTCHTGRVQVVAFTKRSVVLDPNYTAEVVDGDLKVTKYTGTNVPESIETSMFDYHSVPLETVIGDIENHYGIRVSTSNPLAYNYTGRFSKNKSVDEVLYILCKPYGLKYVKLSESKYHILKD